MKKLLQTKRSAKGFTLIEVIITIVVAAILGTIFVTFMGTAVTRSSDQVNRAKNLALAKAELEKISSYYADYLKSGIPGWGTFVTGGASCSTTIAAATLTCVPVPSCPNEICISSGGTIEATIIVGDQKLVTYFMQ